MMDKSMLAVIKMLQFQTALEIHPSVPYPLKVNLFPVELQHTTLSYSTKRKHVEGNMSINCKRSKLNINCSSYSKVIDDSDAYTLRVSNEKDVQCDINSRNINPNNVFKC
jgi:hypothetical protein